MRKDLASDLVKSNPFHNSVVKEVRDPQVRAKRLKLQKEKLQNQQSEPTLPDKEKYLKI